MVYATEIIHRSEPHVITTNETIIIVAVVIAIVVISIAVDYFVFSWYKHKQK